jgi:hypothetical protein
MEEEMNDTEIVGEVMDLFLVDHNQAKWRVLENTNP